MNEPIFMSEPAAVGVFALAALIVIVVGGLAGGLGYFAGKDAQRKEERK